MVVILDMKWWLLTATVGALLACKGAAECPNACTGHGDCDAYDMCACYPGFMGNDCSERICQFGRAHTDTPKGNLDGNPSGVISTSQVLVGSQMYPNGVIEHISGSTESLHEYMECSNKGICNRATGTCQCFTAYEGSACQRASCPNNCNGHGVCRSNRELAVLADTKYGLWDADSIFGCDCDAGYTGPDCSLRTCPYGIDPQFDYTPNDAIVRLTKLAFELYDAAGSGSLALTGTIRIKFYDVYGEDWITSPFDVSTQSATDFEALFESLPNDAVPSISCSVGTTGATTLTYTCEFTSNPGWLKAPEIIMVDEAGGTTTAGVGALVARVYDSGNMGEFTDYFNKNCGVTVTLGDPAIKSPYYGAEISAYVTGTASDLKSCLGDSDGDPSTNVDVEQWDHGNFAPVDPELPGEFPHLVKLANTDGSAPVNAIMWWDDTNGVFKFQTRVPNGNYAIYATDGTLARVVVDDGSDSDTMDSVAEMGSVATGFEKYSKVIHTTAQIGCSEEDGSVLHCIEKGDLIVLGMTTLVGDPSSGFTSEGTSVYDSDTAFADVVDNTAEFYKVHSIKTKDSDTVSTITVGRSMFYGDADESFDAQDIVTRSSDDSTFQMAVPIYKFTPSSTKTNQYTYVSQCAGRGLCDTLTGICGCFPGYTGEACASQDALAV